MSKPERDDGGRALSDLDRRLKQARDTSTVAPKPRRGRPPTAGLGLAMRIAVEMVAGVGVGAGLGYALDQWLGTSPWLLIVLFFLGAGAGALNTYRAIAGAGYGRLRDGDGPDD